jgi:hypothetical protein
LSGPSALVPRLADLIKGSITQTLSPTMPLLHLHTQDIPGTPAQMEVEALCRARLEQCAAARLDPVASDALWNLDRKKMTEVLAEANKVCVCM